MVWGPDRLPNQPIILGDGTLPLVESCKHVGVTLTTSSRAAKAGVATRVGTGTKTLLAARGIGSPSVPVTPAVLSKLYWSVAVPRSLYGLEVTPITDSGMEELEKMHRNNARIVQGLPHNVPLPAPLATLGWMSMKSHLAMTKMLFMWRVLCMDQNNIYRKVMIIMLKLIIKNEIQKVKMPSSPVSDMYRCIKMYKLDGALREGLLNGNFGKFEEWKKFIKNTVWQVEKMKWKCTCMLYKTLACYSQNVHEIRMHAWWYLAKDAPHLTKKIACVMSLLMGSQPSGLQKNNNSSRCKLCDNQAADTPTHIIFECETLQDVRATWWAKVMNKLPLALANDFG